MTEHHITIVPAQEGLVEPPQLIEKMRACILETLKHEHVTIGCDIYVLITDDESIRALNAEHRNLDKPTDVLSFPMQDLIPGEPIQASPLDIDPSTGLLMLGDIVISIERARAQAEEYGHSLERELCFLAVHACLHLLGYDHTRSLEEEQIQFSLQDEILDGLGLCR